MTDYEMIDGLRAKIERRRRIERRLFWLACLIVAAVPVAVFLAAPALGLGQ